MAHFNLATRLTLIIVIALLLVWLGTLIVYYRSHDLENKNALPSPTRVAAIVKAVEESSPENRQDVVDALTSDALSVRLVPENTIVSGDKTQKAVSANVAKTYALVLEHHAFRVTITRSTRHLFPWLLSSKPKTFEIRVALKSGGVLVVNTGASLAITRFGWPLGFGAGLFGTLVALAALVLMNDQMRPLYRLAMAVDQMDLMSAEAPLLSIRTNAPEIVARRL